MGELLTNLATAFSKTTIFSRYDVVRKILVEKVSSYILQGILRASFLIELVKTPAIETTKFEVRWADRLDKKDPRYASFEDCLNIFEKIVISLQEALEVKGNLEFLTLLHAYHLLAYEIPLDYKEKILTGQMHSAKNIVWIWDEIPKRAVKLRAFLLNPKNDLNTLFFTAAYEKIKVKTYLTDRVLTGAHKTNREKRWETYPGSVHFALRYSCMEIEYSLINQLCHFEDFPANVRKRLEDERILSPLPEPFRCPITMEPLAFSEFEKEVLYPEHGKSAFQIGHLNPLKANSGDPNAGHTALNISWVSAEGNRIQGHRSLGETRDLIKKIAANYSRFKVR